MSAVNKIHCPKSIFEGALSELHEKSPPFTDLDYEMMYQFRESIIYGSSSITDHELMRQMQLEVNLRESWTVRYMMNTLYPSQVPALYARLEPWGA